ncbi:MAG: sodium:proton antiporter [Sphingobium sp.]|uniref:cation:proton antiporter n=1 Tax=Sphingobium sp. TaxID=1912891 RepID=UPI0029B36167|nr:sodium:proton antiporter [Sphingobium sp.]MDX3911129.1 sodium:proton antiporter [Sphingobium sp.]
MHEVELSTVGLLLFVACLVAIISRRIGLPYTVGLVVAGIALSLGGYRSGIQLTPELIFTLLLPPLVFEAALHLHWSQFVREAPLVLNIAFVGTLLSAAVVACGMHWLIGWGWQAALLFGSLIAATDPVSVIAMMKEQDADKRLRFIMESESLVNDAAAAVLFGLCIAWISGESVSAGSIALSLLLTIAGGVLCGLVVAGGLLVIAGRSDDHLVELTLTVLAAYGSFGLAEELEVSGVLAALSAGMLVGNWGPQRSITERGGQSVIRFWDFAAFLTNSVIFLLIGSREADQAMTAYLWPAMAGIILALLGRTVAIYSLGEFYVRSRLKITLVTRHLLFWGGLRGALALALALAAPTTLPEHDALVSVAFAVVAFSIFVQGLSFPALLRHSKLIAGQSQTSNQT